MRKLALLLMSVFCACASLWAQAQTVTGKITDKDGKPIEGATVQEKGTKKGTITDKNGDFTLSVGSGGTLVITALGFAEVQTKASATVGITLKESSDNLSEVVVTALGIRREKKALGFSVQEVKGENLTIAKSVDISSSLAGKIAGVQLVGSPSSTFDNGTILVRGVSGLGVGDGAMFVVDGTITDQSAVIMDNVESVSVLKGPAASALYGMRAQNGVVLVTTKKGSRKKSFGVDVNLGVTTERIAIIPPYQNEYAGGYTSAASTAGSSYDAQGYYIFDYDPANGHPASWASFDGQRMLEYGADESWGPKIDGAEYRPYYSWYPGDEFGKTVPMVAQPDNVKNFFRTGRNLNNSVALSSGADNYNFRMTYQNQNRTLVIPNANRDQHQLGINGSFDIGKYITISSDATYTTASTKGKPLEGYRLDGLNVAQNFNQWFQRQLDIDKMKTYRQPDGSLNSWNIGDPNSTGDFDTYSVPQYWDNPYYVVNENYGTQRNNRLVGNVGLNIKITNHLNLQSYARMNSYNNENDFRIAGGLNLPSYEIRQNDYKEMNYESNLIYKNRFGAFSVDALAGVNRRQEKFSELYMATAGGLSSPNYFDIAASVSRPTTTRTYRKKAINSVYGKASIGFKDMIYVEGTIRNDWSSALPADDNSFLYPSVSGSFIFSELFKTYPIGQWLSFGKLRASYASVGNDLAAHQLDLAYNNGGSYGSNPSVSIGDQFRGGGIKPAISTAYELGLELRFFKRIGFDVAVYQTDNKDQILPVSVSASSGFTSAQINAGLIQNKGIEASINGIAIAKKNFSWEVTLNWAKNTNYVKELAPGINTYLYATNRYDTRLEHVVNGKWGTYFGRKWQVDEKTGLTKVDATGQPLYDIGKEIGQVLPDWTGGMFNSFRYKGFDLTFSIDFQSGGLFYSETRNFNTGAGLSEETVGINDKGNDWRDFPGSYTLAGGNTGKGGIRIPGVFASGAENNRYITARAYWYTARQKDASNVLLDASYVKLREIRFGYSLPSAWVRKTIMAKSANFGIIVQNAFLIWANAKKYGVDPSELEEFYREGGQLSATRQIGANLRISF